MLTSKNFLWLGFFTTLLFLTFCVTFNLDKLNPNIVNITPEELNQRELQIDENLTFRAENSNKEPTQFTIIEIAKKEDTHINVIDKFNTTSFLEQQNKKVENNTSKTKIDTIQKSQLIENYTKIIENKNFSFSKKLSTAQKQILNRLAYKTKIDDNTAIFIKTSDKKTKNIIESYLEHIGLEKSKIKLDPSLNKSSKVNLSLRKRG